MAKQIVNGREFQIYTCYNYNVSRELVQNQKKVFDLFNMEITQELTSIHHPIWMQNKVQSLKDFDILVFFDIDCIPLKPGLYEYILEQIGDNNSIIGIEQARNDADQNSNIIYAGPACLATSKIAYEKMGRPTYSDNHRADSGGELTFAAKESGVNVKFFEITSSLTKEWKCGNKYFGLGTTYDHDRLYHQFTAATLISNFQFNNKAQEILRKYA
jgi:hypothetical protein